MMSVQSAPVFCTLCEGDYHLGVAALINSLSAHDFKGVFVIGWRGEPPPWIETLEKTASGEWLVMGIRVILEELKTPWLLAHVKPHFMLDVLERLVPEADSVCYADPDIVVDCPWSFFECWMARGVAICEDCCFPNMSRHHYLRLCWQEFAQKRMSLVVNPDIERGYNSGFVGVRRKDVAFLQTWREAMDQLGRSGVPLEHLKPGNRTDPFFGTDQDMMNVATMVHGDRLATLGTEGMGFTGGMAVMWHAVESPKPWRRFFTWDLLRTGRPVPLAHRQYWKFAASPVQSWTAVQYMLRRIDLRVAIILSRFMHSA